MINREKIKKPLNYNLNILSLIEKGDTLISLTNRVEEIKETKFEDTDKEYDDKDESTWWELEFLHVIVNHIRELVEKINEINRSAKDWKYKTKIIYGNQTDKDKDEVEKFIYDVNEIIDMVNRGEKLWIV